MINSPKFRIKLWTISHIHRRLVHFLHPSTTRTIYPVNPSIHPANNYSIHPHLHSSNMGRRAQLQRRRRLIAAVKSIAEVNARRGKEEKRKEGGMNLTAEGGPPSGGGGRVGIHSNQCKGRKGRRRRSSAPWIRSAEIGSAQSFTQLPITHTPSSTICVDLQHRNGLQSTT